MLLDWSHHYKNYTVVITIWLTTTKYPYLNDNESFTFYIDVFVPLSLPRHFLELYIWVTWRVSYTKQELLTLREHLPGFTPALLVWSVLLMLSVFFCDYLLYVFKLRFPHKNDVRFVFTSSFLGELMSYLRCVCLFA